MGARTAARHAWTFAARTLFASCLIALAGCASKGDEKQEALFEEPPGIPYSVELEGSPDEDFSDLLEAALRIYTLAEREPSSLATLRRRVEGDIPLAESALRAAGYLEGKARFEVVPDDSPSNHWCLPVQRHLAASLPGLPSKRPSHCPLVRQPRS